MLALVSTALLWGWPVEGALFSLMWAGILRVGEVLQARRADLVLPQDAAPGVRHILLRIREPKTRGRHARHQAARVDPRDLVELITMVFKDYTPDRLLWEMSASTLRKRFLLLCEAAGLPTRKLPGIRPYDLASLRPGGASWLLSATEDSELVRRRGRWLSTRVMEVYLQEIAVATGITKLEPKVRERIEVLSSIFEQVLTAAVQHLRHGVPCKAWNILFQKAAP